MELFFSMKLVGQLVNYGMFVNLVSCCGSVPDSQGLKIPPSQKIAPNNVNQKIKKKIEKKTKGSPT